MDINYKFIMDQTKRARGDNRLSRLPRFCFSTKVHVKHTHTHTHHTYIHILFLDKWSLLFGGLAICTRGFKTNAGIYIQYTYREHIWRYVSVLVEMNENINRYGDK